MKNFLMKHKGLALIIGLLVVFGTGAIYGGIFNSRDYGGARLQEIKFSDMDSAEVFVSTNINLTAMDGVANSTAPDSAYHQSRLYYDTWVKGQNVDSSGLIFLDAGFAGGKWVRCDTLQTNDTTGVQGVVDLRVKAPYYRIVTTCADIGHSMYNGDMIIWFYNPDMDNGYQFNDSKY